MNTMKLPNERFYQDHLQLHFKAVNNLRLASGKIVDLINDDLVIEVDFMHKWGEAIGQSLIYAYETKKRPCICFIYDYSKDSALLRSIMPVLYKLCIKVYTIGVFDRSINLIYD